MSVQRGVWPGIVCILGIGLALSGWPTSAEEPAPVRVGAVLSLSGPGRSYGQGNRMGLTLAAEEINAAGGVRGRPVELIIRDDGNEPRNAMAATLELIQHQRVIALIGGTTSDVARSIARVCERNRTVFITPFATHPEITRGRRYVFRVSFSDVDQAHAIAEFARRDLQARSVVILNNIASIYSSSLSQAFQDQFTQRGGQILRMINYTPDTRDFSRLLRPLQAIPEQPIHIYLPGGILDTIRIVMALRKMQVPVVLLGADTWDSEELLQRLGSAFHDAYYTTLYHPDLDIPENRTFLQKFRTRFQQDPTPDAVAAYDALRILVRALDTAREWTADAIRDALLHVDYRGPSGRIRFRPSGDAVRDVVVLKIVRGRVHFHRLFSVASSRP